MDMEKVKKDMLLAGLREAMWIKAFAIHTEAKNDAAVEVLELKISEISELFVEYKKLMKEKSNGQ